MAREILYPTADFKDGYVLVYVDRKTDNVGVLYYDQDFTDPVAEKDMPNVFYKGVLMFDGNTRYAMVNKVSSFLPVSEIGYCIIDNDGLMLMSEEAYEVFGAMTQQNVI